MMLIPYSHIPISITTTELSSSVLRTIGLERPFTGLANFKVQKKEGNPSTNAAP